MYTHLINRNESSWDIDRYLWRKEIFSEIFHFASKRKNQSKGERIALELSFSNRILWAYKHRDCPFYLFSDIRRPLKRLFVVRHHLSSNWKHKSTFFVFSLLFSPIAFCSPFVHAPPILSTFSFNIDQIDKADLYRSGKRNSMKFSSDSFFFLRLFDRIQSIIILMSFSFIHCSKEYTFVYRHCSIHLERFIDRSLLTILFPSSSLQ